MPLDAVSAIAVTAPTRPASSIGTTTFEGMAIDALTYVALGGLYGASLYIARASDPRAARDELRSPAEDVPGQRAGVDADDVLQFERAPDVAQFLDHVDFYPGGFDARYGRAVGGIVDVTTRKGAKDTVHGEVKLDLLDGSVFISTPVVKSQKTLGSDDFMKLLAVQFKTQDPMKPMEDTAFIAQMAQFTSLSQSQAMTAEMVKLPSFSRNSIAGFATSSCSALSQSPKASPQPSRPRNKSYARRAMR